MLLTSRKWRKDSEQLMIKIKEEGEQIIEDAEYGKDYIKWKKGEKERREFFRIEGLVKQKEAISESLPKLSLPIFLSSSSSSSSSLSSSSSSSSSPKLTQVNVMKDRLGGHYDPIRDPRLFSENIARRKRLDGEKKIDGGNKKKKIKLEKKLLKRE
jgi:hypothetical protein